MTKPDGEWSIWKCAIDEAVAKVCVSVIREPLLYFSEADVQQLLVEELRKVGPLMKTYPTNVPKGEGSKGFYHTSLIHREYGGGGGTRIDAVILDPDDVAQIDDVNLTIDDGYLRPAYGFELGTEKTTDALQHLRSDVEKLGRQTKGTGYIIHIYKDATQSRTGTRSRGKTEDRIAERFKNVFGNGEVTVPPNVKILAILLRTGRKQKKMLGKCEIFDGQGWVKVNISREDSLREAITDRLR